MFCAALRTGRKTTFPIRGRASSRRSCSTERLACCGAELMAFLRPFRQLPSIDEIRSTGDCAASGRTSAQIAIATDWAEP